jgi:peptide-methionine (S)-S-oxide reductase
LGNAVEPEHTSGKSGFQPYLWQKSAEISMSNLETVIVAGGCFWCTEAVFRDVVGVSEVESGYIGGTNPNPTYKEVCTGTTGHAEAIRVTFDPHAISLAEIFDVFLGTHDPTQLNRQGGDVGTQYRSAIFPLSDEQAAEAEAAIARWNADNGKVAVTTIEGLSGGEQAHPWYSAEGYHQEYWDGEGQRNPYCQAVIPPKLMKLRKSFQKYVKG